MVGRDDLSAAGLAPTADESLSQALSAVMDGQATPEHWARVSGAWAQDPALRERWALWHAAADGLRSADLPQMHREPQALLAALHAQMPVPLPEHRRRRGWWAPLAVAATFVALAVGINTLRPPPALDEVMAVAPMATPRAQGLGGTSFAQAAAGRTLAGLSSPRDASLTGETPPEVIDWALDLPGVPASGAVRPTYP